jgi:hypothetical protein
MAKPIQFGNDMGGGYFSVQAGEGKRVGQVFICCHMHRQGESREGGDAEERLVGRGVRRARCLSNP